LHVPNPSQRSIIVSIDAAGERAQLALYTFQGLAVARCVGALLQLSHMLER
jgi:hypothetical protein